jgi:hypothetical protein
MAPVANTDRFFFFTMLRCFPDVGKPRIIVHHTATSLFVTGLLLWYYMIMFNVYIFYLISSMINKH